MIQRLLAYAIRISGADREVMEKWLYTFSSGVFIAASSVLVHHMMGRMCPHWRRFGDFRSGLRRWAAGHGDVRY